MRFERFTSLLSSAGAILAATTTRAFACPMCKTNIANAENAAEAALTINTAILFLLAPTLALIGALGKLVYNYRHYQNDESIEDSSRSADSYVNLTTSGSERDAQQSQRDPASRGLSLYSTEEHQSPQGLYD